MMWTTARHAPRAERNVPGQCATWPCCSSETYLHMFYGLYLSKKQRQQQQQQQQHHHHPITVPSSSLTHSSRFSYHYWRKLCSNCNCSREVHDVAFIESPIHMGAAPTWQVFTPPSGIQPSVWGKAVLCPWVCPWNQSLVGLKVISLYVININET